ncbi:MAG: hypothetical protein FJ299_10275 [Planctomycetes bacterium]|nr:hypothetical protein [Planctomycetota bacterium]
MAHMHGVTQDVTVAKTLDASGKVAISQQTGLVLDDLMKQFAGVANPNVSIADPTATNCHAEAQKLVQAKLGTNYGLNSTPISPSGLHIWVPREGWVPIDPDEGLSFAFQLQVISTNGPVDQKSLSYVNGELLSMGILVVVQTP